jgi:O-antigen/teichoic acid export membrane protein
MGETLIKNIEYNFVSILLNRIGGLILTIILARFLSPELFGIYSLILSVTLLAMVFTDIGTNNAIIRYVSNAISKKKKKEAKEYFKYFLIVKLVIILISTILLILLGRIISNNIFDKPEMYYPLIVSALYVLLSPVGGIFSIFFYIKKEIRYTTKLETINQIIRIIFSILSVAILSDINKIAGIFLGFALASAYTIFYAIRFTRKHFGFIFKKVFKIFRIQ